MDLNLARRGCFVAGELPCGSKNELGPSIAIARVCRRELRCHDARTRRTDAASPRRRRLLFPVTSRPDGVVGVNLAPPISVHLTMFPGGLLSSLAPDALRKGRWTAHASSSTPASLFERLLGWVVVAVVELRLFVALLLIVFVDEATR